MKKTMKKILVAIAGTLSALCMVFGGVTAINDNKTITTSADVVANKSMTLAEGASQAVTDAPVKLDGLTITITSSVSLSDSKFGVAITGETSSSALVLLASIKTGWGQHRLYVDSTSDPSAVDINTEDTNISTNTISYTDPNATSGPAQGINTAAGVFDSCLVSSPTAGTQYSYSFTFNYEGMHSSGAYSYWSLAMTVVEGAPYGGTQWTTTMAYLLHESALGGTTEGLTGADGTGTVSVTAYNYATSGTGVYFNDTTFSVTVDERPEIDGYLEAYRSAKKQSCTPSLTEREELLSAIAQLPEAEQAEYLEQLAEVDAEEYRWVARTTGTLAASYNVESGHTVLKPTAWGQGYTYAEPVTLDGLTVILGSDNHLAGSRFGFGLVANLGDYSLYGDTQDNDGTVNFTMIPQYTTFTDFGDLTGQEQDALFICGGHDPFYNEKYSAPQTILYADEACEANNYLYSLNSTSSGKIKYFPSVARSNTAYSVTFNKCGNGNYKVTIRLIEGKVALGGEVVAYLPAAQLTDVLATDGTCYITAWGMDLASAYPFFVEVQESEYAATYEAMEAARNEYETAIRQGADTETLDSLKTTYEATFSKLSAYDYVSVQGEAEELTELRETMGGLTQSASVILEDGLTLNYKLAIPDEVFAQFAAISVEVKVGDESVTYNASNFKNVDGKWVCPIVKLGPQWMTENVSLKAIATDANGDTLFERSVSEYSLRAYCDTILADSTSSAALKTTVVDLLNYGAEAQKYVNRNTDKLANADVDSSLAATATVADPASATNVLKVSQGTSVTFTAVTARLEDMVTAYAKFKYDGTDSFVAKVKVGDGSLAEATVQDLGNGYYCMESPALTPLQFDEVIVFYVYVNDVRDAYCNFSINSYIQRNWDHEKAGALITALYRYGVGVSEYVETLPTNKLADANFENGFNVYPPAGGTANHLQTVNTSAVTGDWGLYQWASDYDLGTVGTATSSNGVYTFSDSSKKVELDSNNDTIYLELNGSVEYGDTLRGDGESWPHLLLQQDYYGDDLVRLVDQDALYMQMDYTITHCNTTRTDQTSDLHCAQFVWYVTLQNRNKDSNDWSDYIYFGILLYDNRYEGQQRAESLAVDAGKDDATGKLIYQPATSAWTSNNKSPIAGETVSLNLDILPLAKTVFENAKEQYASEGLFADTTWEDLYIGSTNLGFELPGTYDIGVEISNLGLVACRKATSQLATPQTNVQ